MKFKFVVAVVFVIVSLFVPSSKSVETAQKSQKKHTTVTTSNDRQLTTYVATP